MGYALPAASPETDVFRSKQGSLLSGAERSAFHLRCFTVQKGVSTIWKKTAATGNAGSTSPAAASVAANAPWGAAFPRQERLPQDEDSTGGTSSNGRHGTLQAKVSQRRDPHGRASGAIHTVLTFARQSLVQLINTLWRSGERVRASGWRG